MKSLLNSRRNKTKVVTNTNTWLEFLQKYPWDILSFGVLYAFLLYCVANLNFFKAPHGDIFQYISDGRSYAQGSLPGLMQIPPLHPILIQVVSKLFFFAPFPEFKAASFINILSTLVSLSLVWICSRKYLSPFFTLLTLILLCLHPQTFLSAVNVTPEPLLLMLVLATFYLWTETKYKNLAWILAGISTLAKTEGVLVLILLSSSVVVTFFQNHFFEFKKWLSLGYWLRRVGEVGKENWGMFPAFFMAGMWQVVAYLNNIANKVPGGNWYLLELSNKEYFFDVRFFSRLPKLLFFPFEISDSKPGPFFLSSLIVLGLLSWKIFQKKWHFMIMMVLFSWAYLLLHGLFPAYEYRYFFPVLFCLFLIIMNQLIVLFPTKFFNQIIAVAVVLSLGSIYHFSDPVKNYHTAYQFYRVGYVTVMPWLENNLPRHERYVLIITTEPIFMFSQIKNAGFYNPNVNELTNDRLNHAFIKNSGVNYHFVQLDQILELGCDSISCVARYFEGTYDALYVVLNYENYLMTTETHPHFEKYYNLTKNPLDSHCLSTVKEEYNDWMRLVRYDTRACQDILLKYPKAKLE